MNLFHRHKFDPLKWELLSTVSVSVTTFICGVKVGDVLASGDELTYKNVCLKCGDLVFRTVRTMQL
jgi:hypothetical protein